MDGVLDDDMLLLAVAVVYPLLSETPTQRTFSTPSHETFDSPDVRSHYRSLPPPESRNTLDAIFDHHIIHLMRLLQRPISRRLCDVSYVYIYNPLHGRIPLSRFSFAIRCCLLSLDRPAAFLVQRWCWGIIVLYRSRCRVRLRKTGDIQAHCRRGPLLTKQKYIITS